LRQSLNRPIQSLNVPIFATLPGIKPQFCGANVPLAVWRAQRPLVGLPRWRHRYAMFSQTVFSSV
jgi:hypothetical protein